jgi:hypothetical protein
MEGFTFDKAFNSNMDNEHIKLNADAQNICTISPWYMEKYKYKLFPMGVKIVWFLMFFKMSYPRLSKILNMLRLTFYVDDFFIVTNSSLKYHLLKLEIVLARLSTSEFLVWE